MEGRKGKVADRGTKIVSLALSLAIRDGEQASEIGEEFNSGDNCIVYSIQQKEENGLSTPRCYDEAIRLPW